MSKNKAILTLVASSVTEGGSLSSELKEILEQGWRDGDGLCVEDIKPGRRRWLAWGLPREAIEDLITYNEHTRRELDSKILKDLKSGKNFFLISDGGTPAFCDPGRSLVKLCHENGIRVRMINCHNSLLPAVALSGFTEGAFSFLGFPPKDKDERKKFFSDIYKESGCMVFMDTPYRLERVCKELALACPDNQKSRLHFVLMDIERPSEQYLFGPVDIVKNASDLGKREFVWVLAPKTL